MRISFPRVALPAVILAILSLATAVKTVQAQGGRPQPIISCVEGCIPAYDVAVTPDGSTTTAAPFSTKSVTFTVRNSGTNTDTYALTCGGTGAIVCTSLSKTSVRLGRGASASVVATFTVEDVGTATVTLGASGESFDSGSFNVWIQVPADAPLLSQASHPSYKSVSNCIASCFDLVWSHSTPAYFSMGQSRSVQLIYNSATVKPIPVLLVDARNQQTTEFPTTYSVQVKLRSSGALLTMLNGSQIAYYAAPADATTWVRLAAAIDAAANGLVTGPNDVLVTVTAYYASKTTSTTFSSRLLVNDRSGSVFGAGFGLAGLQQMYFSGNSKLILEGDGSAVFYLNGATPGGTSSRLQTVGSAYRRINLDGSFVEFNTLGRMTRSVDRFGNTTVLTWAEDSLLISIADPMGKTLTLNYAGSPGARGKLESVTDASGRVTRYVPDASGRLTTIIDPDSVSTTLTYGDAGRPLLLTRMTNRGGNPADYGYDVLNRLQTITAPSIALHTGGSARPVTTYAATQAIVWQPGVLGTTIGAPKTLVRADTVLARIVDPVGAVTKFGLDPFGAAVKIVDALAQVTTIARDSMGRPTQLTEPNNHTVRWLWGSGSEAPLNFSKYVLNFYQDLNTGRLIQYNYNSRNDVATVFGGISEDVVRMSFTYHNGGSRGPAGAVDTVKVGSRVAEIHTVDSRGRDSIVVHGDTTHKTSFFYDVTWGNLVRTINERGNTTRQHLDAAGRVDSLYTADNKVWSTTYGVMNNVEASRDPLSNLTQMAYNPDLTIKRIVDPKGQIYRYTYNALGAVTEQFDLADTLLATRLAYDSAGRVRTMTNRRGQSITLAYDPVGRLMSRSGSSIMEDTYRYDPAGRWMVATNAIAYDSLGFDLVGNLDRDFQRINGQTYEFRYQYDRQNRPTSRVLYINGVAQTTGTAGRLFDGSGLLISNSGGGVRAALGREAVEGLASTWTINEGAAGSWFMGKLFNQKHQVVRDSFSVARLDTLFKNDVGYDVRERVSRANAGQYFALGISFQDEYHYDDAGRLVQAYTRSSQGTCMSEYGLVSCSSNVYSYDPAGNRIDPLANAMIGAGNRTWKFRGDSLGYDLDGQVTSKVGNGKSWTYSWDGGGRLLEVKEAGLVVSTFGYDALGRRIMRSIPGGVEWYLYDGQNVILDLDNSMAVKREYNWYPGTDYLMSVSVPGTWNGVAINDQRIGDAVRGIADANGGAVLKQYLLTPWGGMSADTGAIVRIQMGGREYDQETELYYMRSRYYDPKLGRFLSEDPAGIAGGLNLYSYAFNDPINLADPTGLGGECPKDDQGVGQCPELPGQGPPPQGNYPLGDPSSRGIPPAGGKPEAGGGGMGATQLGPSSALKCKAEIASVAANLVFDAVSAGLLVSGGGLVVAGGRTLLRGLLAEGASVFYNGGLVGVRSALVVAPRFIGRDLAQVGSAEVIAGTATAGWGGARIAASFADDAAQGRVPNSLLGLIPGVNTVEATKALIECAKN